MGALGSFGRTAAIQTLRGCAVRSEDTCKQCSHISIYSNNTQSVLSGRLLVDGALACVTVLQLYRIFSAVQRSEPAMVPYYTYYKPVEER